MLQNCIKYIHILNVWNFRWIFSDNQKWPKFRPFVKITNEILKFKILSNYLNRTPISNEFSFQQCTMEGYVERIITRRVLRFMYSDGGLSRACKVLRLMYSDGGLYEAYRVLRFVYSEGGLYWAYRVLRLMCSDGGLYRAFRVLKFMYSNGGLYRAYRAIWGI